MCRTFGRTLDELGACMTAREFGMHWAAYRRSPWGEQRDGYHAAQIVQAIGNYAGKIRNEPAQLVDCLLKFEAEDEVPEKEIDPAAFFKHFEKS